MRLVLAVAACALSLAACYPSASANAAEGAAFLAENTLRPTVVTLPSGVQYEVVSSGPADGPHPTINSTVQVHYEAALLNGTVADSSFARGEPSTFPLKGLVPAWEEVVPLMRPGDEWTVWSPPHMAYGDRQSGPIPPSTVLKFRIKLVSIPKL